MRYRHLNRRYRARRKGCDCDWCWTNQEKRREIVLTKPNRLKLTSLDDAITMFGYTREELTK